MKKNCETHWSNPNEKNLPVIVKIINFIIRKASYFLVGSIIIITIGIIFGRAGNFFNYLGLIGVICLALIFVLAFVRGLFTYKWDNIKGLYEKEDNY